MKDETPTMNKPGVAGSSAAALAAGIPPTIFVNVLLQRVG
jgi:hypothetical protein